MASKYTEHYRLCQWEPEDQFLRTEFNEDNLKLDKALEAKADVSALALKADASALSSKADASALALKADASAVKALETRLEGLNTQLGNLSSQLTALTAQVAKKGNCRVVTGSYTGNGQYNTTKKTSLTFSTRPKFVIVSGGYSAIFSGVAEEGKTSPMTLQSGSQINYRWDGNVLSWYNTTSAEVQLNKEGAEYFYMAVYESEPL